MIRGIPLQLPDLNRRRIFMVVDTRPDTKNLNRAHPRTTHPQNVGIKYRSRRPPDVVSGNLANELRDINACRAGIDTGCICAEQTTIGLGDRLIARERELVVLKDGFGSIVRQTLGHDPSLRCQQALRSP